MPKTDHANARAENAHSGKMTHIFIKMCDNQNLQDLFEKSISLINEYSM